MKQIDDIDVSVVTSRNDGTPLSTAADFRHHAPRKPALGVVRGREPVRRSEAQWPSTRSSYTTRSDPVRRDLLRLRACNEATLDCGTIAIHRAEIT